MTPSSDPGSSDPGSSDPGSSDPGSSGPGSGPGRERVAASAADQGSGLPPTLRSVLGALVTDEDEVAEAAADGTLALLAIERLMAVEPSIYTLDELVERTGLEREMVTDLWRSLGYPEPRDDDVAFNDADVEILGRVAELVASNPEVAQPLIQVTRVIGSSMARIASSQIDMVRGPSSYGDGEGASDRSEDEEVATRVGILLPVVPKVLELNWRRHLTAAARQRMMAVSADEQVNAVVGFADLVGFTALSQQMSDRELANIVTEFENLVFDVITAAGGRVVKMIGDEVMFTVPTVKAGAEIALSLVEGTRASDELSDVRVGMAYGPVLQRESDLYGPVVNTASRVTVVALPGTVVVGPSVADELRGDRAYVLRSMRSRYLKDIGRMPLYALRRTVPLPGRFTQRRQALRDAVRARLDPD